MDLARRHPMDVIRLPSVCSRRPPQALLAAVRLTNAPLPNANSSHHVRHQSHSFLIR